MENLEWRMIILHLGQFNLYVNTPADALADTV